MAETLTTVTPAEKLNNVIFKAAWLSFLIRELWLDYGKDGTEEASRLEKAAELIKDAELLLEGIPGYDFSEMDRDIEFKAAYHRIGRVGLCRPWGTEECRRVFRVYREWIAAGRTIDDLELFINEHANTVVPGKLGPNPCSRF